MNDDKLIKLIKSNPSKGLSAAIEQYGPLVKTIVVRIIGYENQQDAEESVSDVFVELWKSIDNFNSEKGNLKNYIISIARHVGINTYRRKLIKHELIPLEENNLEIDLDLENEVSKVINKMNEIYRLTPNYILPWKYSNIFVEKNFRDIYVDNIGFAENKLCIRFAFMDTEKNNLGDVYFINKNNAEDIEHSEFMFTDEKGGIKYDYYIFDIKNMEELKNYDLKYEIVSKLGKTEGEWEVNFKADYKNTTETIRLNKEAEINDKKYTVKNIKISPIAINVEMKNNLADTLEDLTHNFSEAVSVMMKDGSTAEISGSGSSTNSLSSSVNLMFKQPIDTSKIEKIKIGNLEIPLTEDGSF